FCDDCPGEERTITDIIAQVMKTRYPDATEDERAIYQLAEMTTYGAGLLRQKTDEAQWSAYTANLALAQAAMDAGNWPEARERLAQCPESKRGWEWTHLSHRAQPVRAVIRGTGNTDDSAWASADGRYALVPSR